MFSLESHTIHVWYIYLHLVLSNVGLPAYPNFMGRRNVACLLLVKVLDGFGYIISQKILSEGLTKSEKYWTFLDARK